jgi:hypothetical protein
MVSLHVSNTINVKKKERERREKKLLLSSLSIGKAKGRKERIESKSIISIFTILYTRLILSANRSNDRERKQSKNVALNRGEEEKECGFFFASFLDVCKRRKKNAKKKIIIYKSSTGCMQ